jgi:calcium permeable stress-gated cation channel
MGSDPNAPAPASAWGLVDTLIPTLIIALVYVTIFLILRRSQRRFYAPRTYLGNLREQ